MYCPFIQVNAGTLIGEWGINAGRKITCKCFALVFDNECYDAYVFLRAFSLSYFSWLLSLLLGYLGNSQQALSGARANARAEIQNRKRNFSSLLGLILFCGLACINNLINKLHIGIELTLGNRNCHADPQLGLLLPQIQDAFRPRESGAR